MITNSNILNVQVVPSTPMFISSNSPGQKQVMHPEWIQWYRAIQTRVGGATGTLITSIDFKDLSTTPIYTITNSEDTSSGTGSVTITIALNPEDANLVFAGPSSGTATEPDFRMLINNDLPIVNILHGGTGLSTLPADGQLLIGDTATNAYVVANMIGTLNRLDVTNGGGTISLDIDSNYVGQTSITTLGTITSGIWNADVITIEYGGTGLSTTPTDGQLLIGNGSGYTLAQLTEGAGITITSGTGTITISNAGATSLIGTANEIAVSSSTGAITISLPQNVVIPTPSSGVALSITGALNTPIINLISGISSTVGASEIFISRNGSTSNSFLQGPSIQLNDTLSSTSTGFQHSGGQTELWQFASGSWSQIFKVLSTLNTTFNFSVGINGNSPPSQSTGWGTPTNTGVISNFDGSAATLTQCSEVIAELITILKNFGLLAS